MAASEIAFDFNQSTSASVNVTVEIFVAITRIMCIILEMRYRSIKSAKVFRGQVLTPEKLAARLAQSITVPGGDWLELGVGSGRLLEACVASHSIDRYVAVELDRRLAAKCATPAPTELHFANVLQPDALDAVLGNRRFSCTVGNPPFGVGAVSPAAQARLKALYPQVTQINAWARLDLYFLLESLARLKRPGEAAFIVAAPIVQDPALATFRQTLIDSASEIECHELPADTFDKRAEVQSFLLIARFGQTRGANVTLGRLVGTDFELTVSRRVSRTEAIHRMDLAHHEFQDFTQALARRTGFTTLEDLGARIVRGSRSRHQFEDLGIEHFHTSDFPQTRGDIAFGAEPLGAFQTAEAGNILVPRVGTRCIDRAAFVAKGRRAFTEAVYRVVVPQQTRVSVFDWISSEEGKAWRRSAAHGSCAKHLTVGALMAMPVPA